jgi:hypothetical protein
MMLMPDGDDVDQLTIIWGDNKVESEHDDDDGVGDDVDQLLEPQQVVHLL